MEPADKLLYALRDVTATVPSIPLIASSVMSKKIAAGADAIVLDVKFGRGAFMPDVASAEELAAEMVELGEGAGRRTVALVTAMDNPLGRSVGNALEVQEALDALAGVGDDELLEVCLRVTREMCEVAGVSADPEKVLRAGAGRQTFERMLAAQDGHLERGLPVAPVQVAVKAESDGHVEAIDALEVGLAVIQLDVAHALACSREYGRIHGRFEGIHVCALSSGMGGPSVAIGVEELHELGVHTLLRVGTCGALQPGIKMGDLVIAIGAVRSEGTPDGYVPKEYPAIASLDVVNALIESAEALRVPYHVGLMRSVDALYSDLVPDQMPRPDLRGELEMWTKAGIIGNDMETSTLLIVSRLRKMRAGTVCLCVDEVGAGEIHHLDPSYMDRMLAVAVDAIRRLIKRDASAAKRQ